MRVLLSVLVAVTLFVPFALADNCASDQSSKSDEKVTCPYMKAKADGDTKAYEGKVCPVTGKKAVAKDAAVCPVTGKTMGKKAHKCGSSCKMKCDSSCKMKCSGKKDAKAMTQKTCPVMGGKINKDLYVDHDGKRIYLCCKGCIGKVKADPEKYIKQMEEEGITLAKAETTEI